jgi:tRNA threonylcarbamoyl adenosine modification protein YeaZ
MKILVLQSTFTHIECGIFLYTSSISYVDSFSIDKFKSATLISNIKSILVSNNLSLKDIDYCIVNRGPSPFTTLRTVISIANGFCAVIKLPLIGIDGLKALTTECVSQNPNHTQAIILNAFAGDFYVGIVENDCFAHYVLKKEPLLVFLKTKKVNLIHGNGIQLLKNDLMNLNILCMNDSISTPSLLKLCHEGIDQINHTNIAYVTPLYLKQYTIF